MSSWRRTIAWIKAGLVTSIAAVAMAFGSTPSSAIDAAQWKEVVAAANKEGKAVLYVSVAPAQVEAVITAFSAAYPAIKLEVFQSRDSVINQRLKQEIGMGRVGADVIFSTKNNFYDELKRENGLILPKVPSFEAANLKTYQDAVIISQLPLLIAYNATLVKDEPRNYEDFLGPEFKGRLGIPVVDGSPVTTAWWDFLRKTHPGYWEKLAALQPRIYASSVPLSQAVASGEISVAILASPGSISALINKGAPLKMVSPDQVYGMDLLLGVLRNSPNPNAALVLADFLLSKAGQTAINAGGLGISILPDVPGALPAMSMVISDPNVDTTDRLKTVVDDWKKIFAP